MRDGGAVGGECPKKVPRKGEKPTKRRPGFRPPDTYNSTHTAHTVSYTHLRFLSLYKMAAEEDRVRYFAVLSVGEFLENNRKTYLKVKAGLCLDVIDASTRAEPQSKLQPYIYIRAPDWAVATSEEGDRFRNALFPEDLAEDGQLRVVRVNLDAFRPTNKRKMVALDTHDDPPQVWDPEVHGQVALVRPYLVVSRDQDDKVLMVQSVNSPLGQEFHWKVVEQHHKQQVVKHARPDHSSHNRDHSSGVGG